MAGQERIIENPEVVARVDGLVGEFGDPQQIDHYDDQAQGKYAQLIENVRPHVMDSILAASLVDVEDCGYYRDAGEHIGAALNINNTIRGWQRTLENDPDAVGLYIGDDAILFKNQEIRTKLINVKDGSQKGVYIYFDAPIQAHTGIYGGRFDGSSVSHSIVGQDSRRGMYQIFTVRLFEIDKGLGGNGTPFPRQSYPPLTVGRASIESLHENLSEEESVRGGVLHRHQSLPYVLWRLTRIFEDPLAESVDRLASQYGLQELWTDQYCREIGAQTAHLISKGYAKTPEAKIPFRDALLLTGNVFGQERDILNPTQERLISATEEQCRRIGVLATASECQEALQYYAKRDYRILELDTTR